MSRVDGGEVSTGARLLDGVQAAAAIKRELTARVAVLAAKGVVPGLATVLVGDDPGSSLYVAGKHRDCAQVGIASLRVDLPGSASQAQLEDALAGLNENPACTGYIVQLPLPAHLDEQRVLELIDPGKDADGLHPQNLGRLVLRPSGRIVSPLPCTPRGIVELASRNGVSFAGRHVVVLGRGVTVGRPLGLLLTRREVNATVTLTHTGTRDLRGFLRQADVVVAASGVAGLVRGDDIRPGAVVFDVGVSRVFDRVSERFSVCGDVDEGVRRVASWVSPNPGGVGPMTRAMLLQNVVEIAERNVC